MTWSTPKFSSILTVASHVRKRDFFQNYGSHHLRKRFWQTRFEQHRSPNSDFSQTLLGTIYNKNQHEDENAKTNRNHPREGWGDQSMTRTTLLSIIGWFFCEPMPCASRLNACWHYERSAWINRNIKLPFFHSSFLRFHWIWIFLMDFCKTLHDWMSWTVWKTTGLHKFASQETSSAESFQSDNKSHNIRTFWKESLPRLSRFPCFRVLCLLADANRWPYFVQVLVVDGLLDFHMAELVQLWVVVQDVFSVTSWDWWVWFSSSRGDDRRRKSRRRRNCESYAPQLSVGKLVNFRDTAQRDHAKTTYQIT